MRIRHRRSRLLPREGGGGVQLRDGAIAQTQGPGPAVSSTARQDQQWSRHAAQYDDLFLDPFRPGVENPWLAELEAVPDPGARTVIALGCGPAPLLPRLVGRFGTVIALDFAPGMIARARERLGPAAESVVFETRPMHDLGAYAGRIDVAVAVNSLVMPDVREIDRTLAAVRAGLRPEGVFLGVVPAMD